MKKTRTEPFVSGHKTFDRGVARCDILTGNVYSDVQTSSFVRSFHTTECNGFTNPEGHLRKFDMSQFGKLPAHVHSAVMAWSKDNDIILYRFFHCVKGSGSDKIVHGYVITHTGRYNYGLLQIIVTGPTHKSDNIVRLAAEYVSEKTAFRSVSPHEFIWMAESEKQMHRFFVDGKEVVSCHVMDGDNIITSESPKHVIYLTAEDVHVRIGFADGTDLRTNYGCRIRVEERLAA